MPTEERVKIPVDEDMIFFAFRYCLGRMSAAVGWFVTTTTPLLPQLEPHTRKRMYEEISIAISRKQAGQASDIADWETFKNSIERSFQ